MTGPLAGGEVVRFYLRDRVAAVVRPVMELKGLLCVHLQPGESRERCFVIDRLRAAFAVLA